MGQDLYCRHRRLAVREAWASPSQLRGEAVVRFILSEDEQTSQVAKEVETYKDIVFLHVSCPQRAEITFDLLS